MTPPCPAPAGYRWDRVPLGSLDGWGLADAAGYRLLAVRYADGWTLTTGDGTILRDGVTAARLPAVLIALLNPSTQE